MPTPHTVFSFDALLNKHVDAVHVTVLLCEFSNENWRKNASKTGLYLAKFK